ncbi:MAG: DUF4169 family protein [Robiginitomaculum sp.]
MTDNIINFKTTKKKAGYAKKEAQATKNRTKFGRTKAEKCKASFEESKANTHLNNHKLTDE